MKLILTSKDFLNEKSKTMIIKNLDKKIDDCKILFIPPASSSEEEIMGDKYYKRLEKDGFKKENIYILNYKNINSSKKLNIDAIYVGGGNTFELLKKLKDTHFDKEIIKYVKKDVIYIGGSAGTHIVTANIKHVLPFDDNKVGLTDFDGLGLFDGIIFCHYTKNRKNYYEQAKKEGNYNVHKLTDEETFIIDK